MIDEFVFVKGLVEWIGMDFFIFMYKLIGCEDVIEVSEILEYIMVICKVIDILIYKENGVFGLVDEI